MDTVIKIIGIVIICIAVLYMIKPGIIKALIRLFSKGSRLYLAGVLRLALAVVLFVGATQCDKTRLVIAFGVLCLLSALLVFALGPKKLSPMLKWYLDKPDWILRIIAAIALAFGALIVYSA